MKIEVKIDKLALVEWKKLVWLQPKNLKTQTPAQFKKLKESLIENGFRTPFYVWQGESDLLVVDGHHREKALSDLSENGFNGETVEVPAMLPAIFIHADSKREAVKTLLVLNSHYATMQNDSLVSFLEESGVDFSEAALSEIPGITVFDGEDVEAEDMPDMQPGPKPQYQTMNFTLHDSQVEIVKQALQKAKPGSGSDVNTNGNANALTAICEAFLE